MLVLCGRSCCLDHVPLLKWAVLIADVLQDLQCINFEIVHSFQLVLEVGNPQNQCGGSVPATVAHILHHLGKEVSHQTLAAAMVPVVLELLQSVDEGSLGHLDLLHMLVNVKKLYCPADNLVWMNFL